MLDHDYAWYCIATTSSNPLTCSIIKVVAMNQAFGWSTFLCATIFLLLTVANMMVAKTCSEMGGGRCKEKVILSQESYMVGSDTWMCNVILSLIVDQPSSWLVLYTKGGCVLSWCHHLSLHMLVDACIYDPSSFFLSLIFLFTFLLRFEWL